MTGSVLPTTEHGRPDGRPVVVLHGGGGPGGPERAATASAAERRWIFPELRGFGAVSSPPWTLEQHAQDVAVTVDSLRVEMADLIGFSLGGTVAFAVVRLVPARVRSVVVIDCHVSTPDEFLTRRVAERTSTEMWRALRQSIGENLPPTLGSFAGDVLVLESGLTEAVTEAGKAAIRSELGPRLRVVALPDAGHDLLGGGCDGGGGGSRGVRAALVPGTWPSR